MVFLGGIVDLPLQVALISGVPPSFHYGGQGARNLPSSLTLLPRHSERSEEPCIYSVTSAAGKLVLVALWPTGIPAHRGALYLREEVCKITETKHLSKEKFPRFARNDGKWGVEKEIQDFSLRSKLKDIEIFS